MTDGIVPGLDVSRETVARLERYLGLLAAWNGRINLVGPQSLDDGWNRHIADSAQLWRIAPQSALAWLDLGSGGGLPGVVIAMIAQELRPKLRVTMVESDQRKAAFLMTVVRELGLENARVLPFRAEHLPPQAADILSARALAPLVRLLPLAARHLGPSGYAIFPKGRSWAAEVEDALALRRFSYETHQSQTDPDAVILKVKDIFRA